MISSLALLLSLTASQEVQETPATDEVPPAEVADTNGLTPYQPGYRDLAGVLSLLDEWEAQRPDSSRFFVFNDGTDGREVPTLEVFGPGPRPPAERPGILLLGGLDGRSLAGGEAVLSIVHDLLKDPSTLPPDVSFFAVPWASPRALGITLAGTARDGRNDDPTDEDLDGRADEDGPDDIDGDGVLYEMLVPDPEGPWALDSPTAFPRPVQPGDANRYVRTLEGRDDDGDGRFNEDGLGGTVLDRNFPLGRRPGFVDPLAGRLPMSAPLARALADLVLRRPIAIVVCFQGEHGSLAWPGGTAVAAGEPELPFDVDRPVFEAIAERFARATGRTGEALSLRDAWLTERPGAALDWMYAVPGVLAIEVAPWGPTVALGEERAAEIFAAGRTYETVETAWLRWVDNDHGGIGHATWRDVELDNGQRGLLGGWDASVRLNPPVERLGAALDGLAEFVNGLSDGMPRLEVQIVSQEREGDLVRFGVRISNVGTWPTGLATSGRWRRAGEPTEVRLELELPPDATLLAGEPMRAFGRLAGGQSAPEVEWIVLAPQGTPLTLRVVAPWAQPIVREVRP